MRILAVVVVLAGCIDASLVPCGDKVCASGETCLAGPRCVSADQLRACANAADGTPCTIDGTAAKCSGGACTPEVCGNGVIDPGEVCDDGNQVSADGCNATCTSTEVCGNGIVDLEVGEGCDCGTPANPSPLCRQPNSADLSAPCDLNCQPRYCGDGVVDGIEQCDGSVSAGITCATFGFYRGTVSCSSICQLSPMDCSGRCGDGTLDSTDGEYCDGAVPTGDSCLVFGFDLGSLACNNACGPGLGGCDLFGWSRAQSVVQQPMSIWARNGLVAVVYADGSAYVRATGTWIKAPDSYSLVTGTETTVWAVGDLALARWTAADGWVAMTPGYDATGFVNDAWASDTLGLYVSFIFTSRLAVYRGGTWSRLDGPWNEGAYFLRTTSQLWVDDNATTTIYDGNTLTPFTDFNFVGAGTEDANGSIWLDTEWGVVQQTATGWQQLGIESTSLAAGRSGVYGAFIEGGTETRVYEVWRIGEPPLYVQDLPDQPLIAADGDVPYAIGADGLYELGYGEWRDLGQPSPQTIVALAGGALTMTDFGGNTLAMTPTARLLSTSTPDPSCVLVGVTANNGQIASCSDGVYDGGQLAVPNASLNAIWAAPDGETIVGGGAGGAFGGQGYGLAFRESGVWSTVATGFTIPTGITGDAPNDLYIQSSANSLFHFDGANLAQIASGITGSVVVTPTTVYAFTSNGAIAYSRAIGTTTTANVPAGAHSLAGTGGEELFALADASNRGSPLYRFDGQTWSPVRLPIGIGSQLISVMAVGRDVVVTSSIAASLPTYFWLQRTGPW